MFIDTHCHLDFPDYTQGKIPLPQILQSMAEHKVSKAITISVDLDKWENLHQIALNYPNIFCSVGVHPDYENARDGEIEELIKLAQLAKVVAIGECGLDYYQQPQKPLWQEERFIKHISAAKICNKPLVIHSRDCGGRMLEILKVEKANDAGGVMHCFTDTWDIAKAAIDMGFYISFSGIISFKNAYQIHEVAKKVPIDKYLIETDSPFLAPVPFRGKTNQPAYVSYVAQAIAKLRNITIEEVASQTTQNANTLFNFDQYSN